LALVIEVSSGVDGGRPLAAAQSDDSAGLAVWGAFSGIGGLELGLGRAGHHAVSLCEVWAPAQDVLRDRFPGVPLIPDITEATLPADVDLVAAGFPCTDLSLAGSRLGLDGPKSGLIKHVLNLVRDAAPDRVLLENVPNLLVTHRGSAMRFIVETLEDAGYRWAYRTVDSRFTGVPQRRLRVIVLASRVDDPRHALLAGDTEEHVGVDVRASAYGFYWTEGRRGLGWTRNAIPTLKGGSTVGIPSQPAVWLPDREPGHRLVLPKISAGERLQGFPMGWTRAAAGKGKDHRWKLIGNAVTVGVAEWIGQQLTRPGIHAEAPASVLDRGRRWPSAGWGGAGETFASAASAWPRALPCLDLASVLTRGEVVPLSLRAACGFRSRLGQSGLVPNPDFASALDMHIARLAEAAATVTPVRARQAIGPVRS